MWRQTGDYFDREICCFLLKDGQERTCDSLSLIDAVVPEIVENRRRELQQQQQQQQSSSSSSGPSIKTDAKLSSRTAATTASNLSNINDKDTSSMHQPTNTSPQSTNQTISERNMDTSTTSNGGMNYGNFFIYKYFLF